MRARRRSARRTAASTTRPRSSPTKRVTISPKPTPRSCAIPTCGRRPARRREEGATPRRGSRSRWYVTIRCRRPRTCSRRGAVLQRSRRSRERAAPPAPRPAPRRRARRAEQFMGAMDEIYSLLVTIDYPDGVTGGLAPHDRRAARACSNAPAATSPPPWSPPVCRARSSERERPAGAARRRFGTPGPSFGGVAQPGRALRSQRRSRGFKSHHLHWRCRLHNVWPGQSPGSSCIPSGVALNVRRRAW